MEPNFPQPVYFGRRRHWRLSDLLNYERGLTGLSPLELADPVAERWLTAAQVRERYGVSDMWIWRRIHSAYQTGAT
jgi:predicted DNA-binding transcriptional regulator AlpA